MPAKWTETDRPVMRVSTDLSPVLSSFDPFESDDSPARRMGAMNDLKFLVSLEKSME